MFVTLTSIRLKSPWLFFKLANHGRKVSNQAKKQQGFIRMKNTGFGKLHYTLSAWQSLDDMKKFAREGAHLEAMKQTQKLATELRVYTYESEALPKWKEGKKLLMENGKLVFQQKA